MLAEFSTGFAADDGAIAWLGDPIGDYEADPLWYMGAGSDEATIVAKVDILAGNFGEVVLSGGRVCFVVQHAPVDSGGPEDLCLWRPGDSTPTVVYSVSGGRAIGDVQVVGDRVLFHTMRPDNFRLYEDYVELADPPHEWRILDLRTKKSRRLEFGRLGAQAVLGDSFIAWVVPSKYAKVQYASLNDDLSLNRARSIGNLTDGAGRNLQPVALRASGRRLIWGLSRNYKIKGMATWAMSDAKAARVPGAGQYNWYTLSISDAYVAWAQPEPHLWKIGDTTTTVLSDAPAGGGVALDSDAVAYMTFSGDALMVYRRPFSGQPELVWQERAVGFEPLFYESELALSENRLLLQGSDAGLSGTGLVLVERQ